MKNREMGKRDVGTRDKIAKKICRTMNEDYLNELFEHKPFGKKEQEQIWTVCEGLKTAYISVIISTFKPNNVTKTFAFDVTKELSIAIGKEVEKFTTLMQMKGEEEKKNTNPNINIH
jgi:hypothetical protein